jgi:hypothetical protein
MLSYLQARRSFLRVASLRWAAVILLCLPSMAAERPQRAFIDGHDWKIKWLLKVPLGTDFVGETECRIRTIFLQINGADEDSEQTALQHELLHAFTCKDGEVHNLKYNSTNENKHEGIYFLAPKLIEFMQQKPKVVKFLEERP